MKVFVVGDMKYYASFINDAELIDSLKDADIVLFTGGEDITPSLYHAKQLSSTYCNPERDLKEKEIFEKVNKDQLCIGICRGLN